MQQLSTFQLVATNGTSRVDFPRLLTAHLPFVRDQVRERGLAVIGVALYDCPARDVREWIFDFSRSSWFNQVFGIAAARNGGDRLLVPAEVRERPLAGPLPFGIGWRLTEQGRFILIGEKRE